MGHYRSEMGCEDEDRRREEQRLKEVADFTLRVQAAIDEKGIAKFLAEFILENRNSSSYISYRNALRTE